ncbi:MAG TPA: hypothetical protein VJ824_05235 [Bacillota bacterium]|nr:hypothetical protein [Bacillota bacterium]
MDGTTAVENAKVIAAKNKLSSQFLRKGIIIALFSGLTYGFYSAFLTLGMSKGIWADWYGDNTAGLSAFVITYLLGSLGSAVNDTCSAGWALFNCGFKGKIKDFLRSIKTKPGLIMVCAAFIGGPLASTAYVVGLQMAGSIVIPIAALNPAIGAILGKVFYKQELSKRIMFGIAICVLAGFMIGSTSIGGDAPEGRSLGILFALLAALGWGFEGCVGGYSVSMVDSEIGITIRQVTSGITNLVILLPIIGLLAGNVALSGTLTLQAFASGSAMIWIALAGFCAYLSFMAWYKGNSMCGAALGMACNGTYSFWGPFCCWIILGLIAGKDGWALPAIAWGAAILMVIGIWIISMNPLDLFRNRSQELTNEKIVG